MNREESKELLPIIQAFAEGKAIEYSCDGEEWSETSTPTWNSDYVYRIKPEPKYRPFKSQEECWDEMHKHPDFGWIMTKDKKELILIGRVFTLRLDNLMITLSIDEGRNFNASHCYENYSFTDGTPFGIKEE
ncbi:hypothetical protein [Ruminococcus sp.]|uniref:hypothetical protein n=1 Tax=Ruminococcus sp. TaxID=41978 RepID=UPI003EFC5489